MRESRIYRRLAFEKILSLTFSYLDEHPREVLEGLLVSKADDEAHHEADEEEDVGDHEPGDLHQD